MKKRINNIKETIAERADSIPTFGRKKKITKIDVNDKSSIILEQYKLAEPDSRSYQEKLMDAVQSNVKELSTTTWQMGKIRSQNDLEAFFKQNSNTRSLAKGLSSLATIQQSSLDLFMLLMGATVRNKDDYDEIMDNLSIVENQLSEGNEEVLSYFSNLKRAVLNNKERLDTIEKLRETVNELIDRDYEHDESLDMLCAEIKTIKSENTQNEDKNNKLDDNQKWKKCFYIAIAVSFFAIAVSVVSIFIK